jgi:hypothetical protein
LLPECLDDWVADDNPVRVIDAFVAALDLAELGFGGVERSDEAQSQALRKGAAASACFVRAPKNQRRFARRPRRRGAPAQVD